MFYVSELKITISFIQVQLWCYYIEFFCTAPDTKQ